jgi:hypothetical protein
MDNVTVNMRRYGVFSNGTTAIVPSDVKVEVFRDAEITKDADLSAEATSNVRASVDGLGQYHYGTLGVPAGTLLRDEITSVGSNFAPQQSQAIVTEAPLKLSTPIIVRDGCGTPTQVIS